MAMSLDRIIERARYGLADVAAAAGTSYSTIASYAANRRQPSPEMMLKIAAAFEMHSLELSRLAEQLRKEAGRRSQ
jgi:transcriptional regulator with XRE-family HTH domain